MSSNNQSCAFDGTTFPNPLSGLCTNNLRRVPTSDVTVILLLFFAMSQFIYTNSRKSVYAASACGVYADISIKDIKTSRSISANLFMRLIKLLKRIKPAIVL